jgi:hypothetical protein
MRGGERTIRANVRFGSKADMCSAPTHVRFTLNSDRESRHAEMVMSALHPKADMCGALAYVGFAPIADICGSRGALPNSSKPPDQNLSFN